MSRYNKNPFDDDEEGGFGGSSSRGRSGYRTAGGMGPTSRGREDKSSSYQQRGKAYDDDYGSSSRNSSRGRQDYSSRGSVGLGEPAGRGREGQYSSYQSGRGYYGHDYGSGYGSEEPPMTEAEHQERKQAAVRRMEDSSFNSLRTLNDCVRMGVDTTEELERQAESLDRVERRLDEVHVGLDKGERNLRKIKSPFGGVMNYFSKRKPINEVTDPKGFKPSSQSDGKKVSGSRQQVQKQAPQPVYKSTGSEIVDKNLDQMGRALDDLMGIGELIGEQLDDSDKQIDRVAYKMERDDIKMKKLNQGIKKELYK